jgi:hypothetical protein
MPVCAALQCAQTQRSCRFPHLSVSVLQALLYDCRFGGSIVYLLAWVTVPAVGIVSHRTVGQGLSPVVLVCALWAGESSAT